MSDYDFDEFLIKPRRTKINIYFETSSAFRKIFQSKFTPYYDSRKFPLSRTHRISGSAQCRRICHEVSANDVPSTESPAGYAPRAAFPSQAVSLNFLSSRYVPTP